MKNRILFFGELAPTIVHGISLSNKLNIDLLQSYFEIIIIEEKNDLKEHNKRNNLKIKKLLTYVKEISILSKKYKIDYLYTVFSLSTFGSLKTLVVLLSFLFFSRGKIILHIHRGDFESFYKNNLINTIISKLIFKLIHRLIVLSNNQKKEFSKYLQKDKISVLENSLSTEHYFNDYGNDKGNNNFIYISNYIKEKGIFELLEVFKKNKDSILKCYGGFVNNEIEIRKYQSENIEINNFINGEDKFKMINKSDALILPSWNEGQPTIILEAMMVGTIILTTKVGLIGELLGDSYPFYFSANDIKNLEECIQKFKSYKFKKELSIKLKTMYVEQYSKGIHKDKLLQIFKRN